MRFKRFLLSATALWAIFCPQVSLAEERLSCGASDDETLIFADKPAAKKSVVKEIGLERPAHVDVIAAPESVKSGRRAYLPLVEKALTEYTDVPMALIDAIIWAESGYQADAVSSKGAVGLMQLMPETAKMLGIKDPSDAQENIRGGVRYLAELLKTYLDVRVSLAAYNAGPRAVERYSGIPPFPETRAYVSKVLKLYQSNLIDGNAAGIK